MSFGTNVATPLFLIYETRLDLSRWTLTALFAIYPIGLAPALAYAGPMSDALGRKRVMVPGVVLSGVASLVMMAGADNVALLFVGRFLLGAVSGIVFVVASAWMQELGSADPMWTARLVGMLMYAGFGLGPFIGGVIGQWGPAPLVTPYLIHIVLVAVSLIFLALDPRDGRAVTRPADPTQPRHPARIRADVLEGHGAHRARRLRAAIAHVRPVPDPAATGDGVGRALHHGTHVRDRDDGDRARPVVGRATSARTGRRRSG